MKQGEIWYAGLDPTKAGEKAGYRPVVILSGNMLNEHLQIVITAPLTTKIKNYRGNPILMPNETNGLPEISELMIFHIRSISKARMQKCIGKIDKAALDLALRTLNDILRY
ncbi:type II toxin-antitoxin system PemK/MazF family toxin [Pedobacter changchengzhani]|uniref:mRNA interferase n=1 Tax=Pedobacter changchengzhani TaxID=2529274 RepID=A0A4R5MJS3_9SPHI|nr:type II toxin-antitoxin system PemK/MazF family toxin [Pedobacter changchengzhani]TDG35917.1 type II toxin-antitoxin system PemK/MazF family toxin [Pedobacter changchengzhani]